MEIITSKFSLYLLFIDVNAYITEFMYYNEKSYADLVTWMSTIIQKNSNSSFDSIIIDESKDINDTNHFVVFATIIKKDTPMTIFLGLLEIESKKNMIVVIFYCLIKYLKN